MRTVSNGDDNYNELMLLMRLDEILQLRNCFIYFHQLLLLLLLLMSMLLKKTIAITIDDKSCHICVSVLKQQTKASFNSDNNPIDNVSYINKSFSSNTTTIIIDDHY